MADSISRKPPCMNKRKKISLLYDGFFLLSLCGRLDFIIKEKADNNSLKVLLVIGSAPVRLAL